MATMFDGFVFITLAVVEDILHFFLCKKKRGGFKFVDLFPKWLPVVFLVDI